MSDRAQPLPDPAKLTHPVGELYESLRRFFQRRLRSTEQGEAEDLVQDVFAQLARRAASGTPAEERNDAYVFTAAVNVLRDRARRRAARRTDLHDSFDEARHALLDERTPERVLAGKQSVAALERALAALPQRTRIVFMLYRFENLRRPEIARQLGLSVSSVEKELARAVEQVTALLREPE